MTRQVVADDVPRGLVSDEIVRLWLDSRSRHDNARRHADDLPAYDTEQFWDEMFAGPWVMGEQFTICDPYLYTISGSSCKSSLRRGSKWRL